MTEDENLKKSLKEFILIEVAKNKEFANFVKQKEYFTLVEQISDKITTVTQI